MHSGHPPLELRAQATSRPPNRTPDFAHLIRALDEPVARRFVRARLPPSPTDNPSAQTKPGRLSTRTFVASSQTPSPAPSSAPNRLPDDPLPSPSLCLPSDLRFSPTHPHPEPPSFLASAPSTLRLLSPHLLSPPNRTGTAPGPSHLQTPSRALGQTAQRSTPASRSLPGRPAPSRSFRPSFLSSCSLYPSQTLHTRPFPRNDVRVLEIGRCSPPSGART